MSGPLKTTSSRLALIWLTVLAGYLAVAPSTVSAERFVDLYGGVAFTASDDVSAKSVNFPIFGTVTTESATRRVDFGSSPTMGIRGGYWLESVPWLGGAIDVSYFEADGDNVDITVVPLSFLLMLRWPLLTSDEFPKGRLQPYLGIGLATFFADLTADFTPTVSQKVDDFAIEAGLDLRSGLAWQFHPRFALFGEYRFTHFSRELDPKPPFLGFGTVEIVETTLSTHHFLGGVSFRF